MLKVMTTDLIGQSPGLDSTAPLGKIERRAEPARHGARQRHGDGIIAALDIVASAASSVEIAACLSSEEHFA